MSVTMKLDAPAVRALIKDDEKFELELQAAVIAEIVRGMYDKSTPSVIRDVVDTTFKTQRQALVDAVQADVGFRAHVEKTMSSMVQSIRSSTNSYTTQKTLNDEVKRMINNHIASLVEEQVNKQKDALNASVEAMIMRFEHKFEAAIAGKIERMDKSYHDIAYRAVMEKFAAFATN